MKPIYLFRIMGYVAVVCLGLLGVYFVSPFMDTTDTGANGIRSERFSGGESAKPRAAYFHRLLRDPATGRIPAGIRDRELAYARTLPRHSAWGGNRAALGKTLAGVPGFDWQEVGPFDVGGRTRALAVDATNSNTIIAGGVSGGVWKSTDNGATWTLKTAMTDPLGVTWIAQDTRDGSTDTWYYTAGEFRMGTAGDLGNVASLFGSGLFKSVDNGETWTRLSPTIDINPTLFDSPFDFASKVVVSPVTGTIFVASNGFGIFRSSNGGNSFQFVLGGSIPLAHEWADVAVTSEGTVLATLSSTGGGGLQVTSPGVYRSTTDGVGWANITPESFPGTHERSVIAVAPSNADVAYILTNTGGSGEEGREDIRFHKIASIADGIFGERTANLPDFGDPVGMLDSQANYNMVVAVKPNDENFVFIGGTNLFRSRNGFLTPSLNPNETWVGGYDSTSTVVNIKHYPNQHADQHVIAFDPNNANVMWAGHDGGLSRSANITAVPMTWEDKSQGYNVTQFYTVALQATASDKRVVGGTQDNGSPFFDWSTPAAASTDITGSDGASVYFGQTFIYASADSGVVFRYRLSNGSRGVVTPAQATDQLFIHPFAVDPSDEDVMFYPERNQFWRNDSLSNIPLGLLPTNFGWDELSSVTSAGETEITALSFSTSNPSHRLFFGASSEDARPRIYRLDSADEAVDGEEDISTPNAPVGAYVHHIGVNPNNGNEILVALSNYNIVGLYYSNNGGRTYTAVEGNLEGTGSNGPSIRAAAIMPGAVTTYLAGTSIGLYSTVELNGSNTEWIQESPDVIGNAVVDAIAVRPSDGTVAVATHGRGIFIGTERSATSSIVTDTSTLNFAAADGAQTSATFQSGAVAGNNMTYRYHGTARPNPVASDPASSVPIQYFTLNTSIPDGTVFQAQVTVTYTDAQLDTGNVSDETSLALFRYNSTTDTWQQLTTAVDADANTATATTAQFSLWALAAVNGGGPPPIAATTISSDTSTVTFTNADGSSASVRFRSGGVAGATLTYQHFGVNLPVSGLDLPPGIPLQFFIMNSTIPATAGFEAIVAVSYTDAQLAGVSDEAHLKLFRLNPADSTWHQLGTQINASTNVAEAMTTAFSITSLAAVIPTGIEDAPGDQNHPLTFSLEQNYPNPFNPATTIRYTVPEQTHVRLVIYNIAGQQVRILVDQIRPAGTYSVVWNGRNGQGRRVGSGVYLYRLTAGDFSQSRRMTLVK